MLHFFLWLIEVFLLYLTSLSLIEEVTFFRLFIEDNRVTLAFIVSLMLFFFFLFIGGILGVYLSIAIFLAWPFYFYSIKKEEKELKDKRLKKNKEEIEWIERNLDKREDFAPLLRLGRLYQENEDLEKALKYYKMATSEVKEITLTDTERKIKQIEYFLKSEEENKPFICKNCGKHNYKTSLLCEKCKKMLYPSFLDYIRHYAPVALRSGFVLLIISAILFGYYLNYLANSIFYVFLITDIVLFRRRIKKA